MFPVEEALEPIELALPERAVVLDPRRGFLDAVGDEREMMGTARATPRDEPRTLEHAQVA